jgi:hypothetical protein
VQCFASASACNRIQKASDSSRPWGKLRVWASPICCATTRWTARRRVGVSAEDQLVYTRGCGHCSVRGPAGVARELSTLKLTGCGGCGLGATYRWRRPPRRTKRCITTPSHTFTPLHSLLFLMTRVEGGGADGRRLDTLYAGEIAQPLASSAQSLPTPRRQPATPRARPRPQPCVPELPPTTPVPSAARELPNHFKQEGMGAATDASGGENPAVPCCGCLRRSWFVSFCARSLVSAPPPARAALEPAPRTQPQTAHQLMRLSAPRPPPVLQARQCGAPARAHRDAARVRPTRCRTWDCPTTS